MRKFFLLMRVSEMKEVILISLKLTRNQVHGSFKRQRFSFSFFIPLILQSLHRQTNEVREENVKEVARENEKSTKRGNLFSSQLSNHDLHFKSEILFLKTE